VIAEGAKPSGYSPITKEEVTDSFGHKTMGGVGEFLANEITRSTKIETRSLSLSHLQREAFLVPMIEGWEGILGLLQLT